MDRSQAMLVAVPLFLFFSDLLSLFTSSPPPPKSHPGPHPFHQKSQPVNFPIQGPPGFIGGAWSSNTINIDFCASCSYRGAAMSMKTMLEREFPGAMVILANYPPSFPKRVLSKVVPVIQFGFFGMMMAGEHIFPRLGINAPPQWYMSLRANKFGTLATAWLLGNFIQSSLQSSGAFEVRCNGQLVFSKLSEGRFPGEIELRDVIRKSLSNGIFVQA